MNVIFFCPFVCQVATLTQKLREKESQLTRELERLQTNADRDMFELRRQLDKIDNKYQEQIETIEKRHEEELGESKDYRLGSLEKKEIPVLGESFPQNRGEGTPVSELSGAILRAIPK